MMDVLYVKMIYPMFVSRIVTVCGMALPLKAIITLIVMEMVMVVRHMAIYVQQI